MSLLIIGLVEHQSKNKYLLVLSLKNLIFKRMVGLVHFSVLVERDFTIAFDDEFFPLICHQQKVPPEWPFPIQTDIKTLTSFDH